MARFILDKKKAVEQYNFVRDLVDSVSYSLKTNYDVGKVLEETDSMFSVHSFNELEYVSDKKRIWYFAQGWNKEEISKLNELGVSKFVVDNENDLKELILAMENSSAKSDLLLRMKLQENTIHTGKYFVFGLRSKEINKWIPQLRELSWINKLGIHFHKKTQNVSEWNYKFELEETLSEKTYEKIDLINIGGGLPSKYKNYRVDVLKPIIESIQELRTWLNSKNIQVIIEPGRFICAPSVKLETEILNIYDNNIIVDCSVYNSAMDTFVLHMRLLVDGELEEGRAYTIKGNTPDSMDIFRYKVFLDNPKVGDKIIFLNAGAYTYHTDFCKLDKLETLQE